MTFVSIVAFIGLKKWKITYYHLLIFSKINFLLVIFYLIHHCMYLSKALAFLLIVSIVNSNLWDNIFSETLASSPIILSESINFKFPVKYEGVELQGNLDYNDDIKVLTVTVSKNLLIFPLQVFRLQIQLSQFLLTIQSVLQQCSKFRLVLTSDEKGKVQKLPIQSKIFLINIIFQYQQRSKRDNSLSEYIMMPDLLLKHEEEHEEYEINPILIVNSKGNIVKIYEDKDRKKQVPFSLKSNVKKAMQCEGEVKQLTKQDLYKMLKDSIQNKDYEKIPGFDESKIPKIPGMKDFDISKLPIDFNKKA